MDIAKENQPRISFPRLRRLFNSMSHKKKSPVCSFSPDMRSANSASDIGLNSSTDLMVIDTDELQKIRARWLEAWGMHLDAWAEAGPEALSDKGHFLAYAVPRLFAALHNAI